MSLLYKNAHTNSSAFSSKCNVSYFLLNTVSINKTNDQSNFYDLKNVNLNSYSFCKNAKSRILPFKHVLSFDGLYEHERRNNLQRTLLYFDCIQQRVQILVGSNWTKKYQTKDNLDQKHYWDFNQHPYFTFLVDIIEKDQRKTFKIDETTYDGSVSENSLRGFFENNDHGREFFLSLKNSNNWLDYDVFMTVLRYCAHYSSENLQSLISEVKTKSIIEEETTYYTLVFSKSILGHFLFHIVPVPAFSKIPETGSWNLWDVPKPEPADFSWVDSDDADAGLAPLMDDCTISYKNSQNISKNSNEEFTSWVYNTYKYAKANNCDVLYWDVYIELKATKQLMLDDASSPIRRNNLGADPSRYCASTSWNSINKRIEKKWGAPTTLNSNEISNIIGYSIPVILLKKSHHFYYENKVKMREKYAKIMQAKSQNFS